MEKQSENLYILLISVHGLIRGHDLELGRDADTGGQTKYVVELACALAAHPQVDRVDLLTRQVVDPDVSEDYAEPVEPLCDRASIIRLPAGPEGYIFKELLWDHLDSFADNALNYIRELNRVPNLIHTHYADAGYVGVRLSNQLGVPLIHTGHSLGRVKHRRLLATGLNREQVEERYCISRRVKAEEDTLAAADLVIASSSNEIEDQYGLYDFYQPEYMAIIPPGTDLERFYPSTGNEKQEPYFQVIERFLKNPKKPMILAISRPDERKNIDTLVEAFGESPELQEIANLVIVAGNREDVRELDSGPQKVIVELIFLYDLYNLYGIMAFPKQHKPDDVPVMYRIAAASKGVFVNPALTEPFGLTLIEAAASGIPIVATEDGGPQDIVRNCQNGYLVDPLDSKAIAAALLKVLKDESNWNKLANNGIDGVKHHYSWQAHSELYLEKIQPIVSGRELPPRAPISGRPLLYHDRAIIAELDRALIGNPSYLEELVTRIRHRRKEFGFGIATGRSLESTLVVLKKHRIPMPDVLIVGMGTEIYYAPRLTADIAWSNHIDHQWNPKALRRTLSGLPGLKLQPKSEQLMYKLSYYYDPSIALSLEEITRLLRQEEYVVFVSMSYGQFLDILPIRASKGFALRYFADQWGISLERILVAGGTAGDEDMMRGNTLGVVVDNPHRNELTQLEDVERVLFSKNEFAGGITEAIDYYDFFGECKVPEEE